MKFHPLTMILFSITLLFMTLVYSHPVYIGSILLFMIMSICTLGEGKKIISSVKYGIYGAILIIIVNPLVYHEGRMVIYEGIRLPIIGRFKITLEALAYGGNSALKLICILLIFAFYGVMTDRDDTFSFFSKYAHKLTLTLSMTINMIHRLKLEVLRVKDVMILRGVNFKEKKIIKRVKAYYPILKVIFISSLEGSLDRAESLYSRGYGKYIRTSYSKLEMKGRDYLFLSLNTIVLAVFIYGLLSEKGLVLFYPTFTGFHIENLLFVIWIDVALFSCVLLLWGCMRWKFLKYKI
ncbi:energy-coupling factor transporter transmembrane component T [Anaerophilus nitritogenes]|uniref:energy-coupling factor transporter transmembrane component T n=1 Tax=Anaerophilus nitritogenes TaxID=2498136 RepID=UPI00101D9E90|nr:energy-coupling factor transporter transmembrane component T [Anaerophilus nitritogenes]